MVCLSDQINCFQIIIWFVPCSTIRTTLLCHVCTYMAAIWVPFKLFRSIDGKTRLLMYYNVYKDSSLMFLSQLVAQIWHKVHFTNSTAVIFDLITLEVAEKNATKLFMISHTNAESIGN